MYQGRRNASLEKIYARLNRKYFYNCLPKNIPIIICNLGHSKRGRRYGKIMYDIRMRREPSKKWTCYAAGILLTNDLEIMQLKLTMFHEMNHLYLTYRRHPRVNHGPIFQKGMMRLAKMGAFKGVW